MTVGDDRVYGLKGVVGLVREFMTRVERDGGLHSVDHPVLVVEGFRGTGKTALLRRLEELLDQVPHARLDLEKNPDAAVPAVLSAIAFDLSRKYPKYELRFPRFIVGQLVMRLDLDLTDHSQARGQVVAALERHRDVDTYREFLAKTAETVIASSGSPITPPQGLVRLGVTWLTRRAPGQRLALGPFQHWYGHRGLGLHNDPIDVLVDLNRWAADHDDEDNRQRIDELLLAAFLADLRAEFARGRRADERSLNCVVLLDNADAELGRRFLGQLVHARRQRAVGDQDDPDPLTVVATSRGTLLATVPEADQARADDGQQADWSRFWWLGYRLPDLTEDEVDRAITDMGPALRKRDRLTRIVYGLTGGHPASTGLLLEGIAASPPEKWIEPETILGRADPASDQQVTLADQLFDRLLVGISDAELRDLITCAPARRRAEALALAGQDDLLVTGQAGYEEVIDPLLWPAGDSAGLALLRRLLLRRLAARTDGVTPSAAEVYGRLRGLARDKGAEADELYYALADGELGFVADRLRTRLTELTSTEWFELATSVARAPGRPAPRQVPIDEVRAMVESAGLAPATAAVGRLVAALHIAADPFTDSRRRDVHLQIAHDYAEVARLCPGGPHAVFLEASRHHRREAERWD